MSPLVRILLLSLAIVLLLSQQFVKAQEGDDKTTIKNSTNTSTTTERPDPPEKTGKVFSLFSVVTFKNTGCKSQSTMSSGQSTVRNGTCFTSSECSSKGGSASGNCAAGFGVCCLFLVSTSGSIINQNCTYLRNPSFPSAYTSTSALTYTINKCSSDICYLRLDFETFVTLGPQSTVEAAAPTVGSTCPDQFKVTTNTGQASALLLGQTYPILCGTNTGQHMYIDIGTVSTDSVTFSFTFSSTITTTTRSWEIKISQITCSNLNRPPNGCLQYFTTPQGRITTFNFTPTTSAHLDNMLYTACIRRSQGYCCTQYYQCEGVPNSFTLDGLATAVTYVQGAIDTACTLDYVTIPGSSTVCSATSGKIATKYCGRVLGQTTVIPTATTSLICDCTGNFQVGFRTDALQEMATTVNRGVCLDYMQIPCVSN